MVVHGGCGGSGDGAGGGDDDDDDDDDNSSGCSSDGRGAPRVAAALVGNGEGRLILSPVHKENILSRSKEDLAQEAALVLQQVGSLRCVAHDNRRLPGKFSTLPARRGGNLSWTPKIIKKKTLERSNSDASSKKLKSTLAKFFSPKLERKRKPVGRSVSDAGTSNRQYRKRSGSESEGSHLSGSARAKKQLSPIIEASPQVDQTQPFHFGVVGKEEGSKPNAKKSKQEEGGTDVERIIERVERKERIEEEIITEISLDRTIEDPRKDNKLVDRQKRVDITNDKDRITGEEKEVTGSKRKTEITNRIASPERKQPEEEEEEGEVDEVDRVGSMLHSSRYDLQKRGEESTINKMIHRLTNDRSPPPQLTRTMVSPGPGFGHNNNRPFSYTRPNDSCSPPPSQTNVMYAQVQTDKKKAQRSHSDSDEGLGLERKDSSRENSPAEKEYRRTDYSYSSDLRRNNEINNLKSRYEETRKSTTTSRFGNHFGGSKDFLSSRDLDNRCPEDEIELDRRYEPEKYTSTIFVDTSGRDSTDLTSRQNHQSGISNKTSELSARRDLLESRIKSRLLADEMYAAKNTANVSIKKSEHEIIDKPIVPSPVTPNRISSPKRYTDTYITETRTSSNGEKYIFEKQIHEDNGKVYGYEKKITNKIPSDGYVESKPRDGYTVETRTDKYGDKYIVETRTHGSYADDFKPFLSDRSRTSPEERFENGRNHLGGPYKSTNYLADESTNPRTSHYFRNDPKDTDTLSSPIVVRKFTAERKLSKSDDFLDRDIRPNDNLSKMNKNFESIRGMSKSTQRLNELNDNPRILRNEYTTRSHENLCSHVNYPSTGDTNISRKEDRSSPFAKRHLDILRERPIDDYDTDISQMTNSQLESKYYKETRTTQRYSNGKHPIHDDYDSSPPRIRTDRTTGPNTTIRNTDPGVSGHNSSRYDSDTTARESIRRETRYDERTTLRTKDHRNGNVHETEPKKPLRRSRNHLEYFDDSDARESPRGKSSLDETPPTRPLRSYHENGKSRHGRTQETRAYMEQRRYRETRLSDPDRKDRLADSGIENDYRRDSQEADRRETIESEDEGFASRQFIKNERRHTDRNMNLTPLEQRKYNEKYSNDIGSGKSNNGLVTSKPPTGADKKYEKKAAKKSGTMSKVKQLFSKREKKAKEEKNKKNSRSGSSGALTDDEVTMRYREYRGDRLRSAKSARDLGSDINQVRISYTLMIRKRIFLSSLYNNFIERKKKKTT
ncbi:hypothetical protein M0804_003485 [Polistes exclamans]|nr:hypothetical protein M0804_003485 [Polistes exclamans]